MLTVTDKAKQLLKEMGQVHSDDPEACLRLSVDSGGQFGLTLDSESEDDQVVEHEGAKVLLIAPGLSTMLEGRTLDVQDTEEGPKLIVTKEKQSNSKD